MEIESSLKSNPQSWAILRLIARISAWLLLAGIIVLLVSGWGITHTEIIYKASFHLIDRGLANRIHHDVQIPMAAILITHVFANLRLNLRSRSKKKSWLFNSVLIVLGVCFLVGVVYMERYA
jgi:uncharacterized membrane protein YgdD (TMEM256/DUF423 family)